MQPIDIARITTTRHTCKAFDPPRLDALLGLPAQGYTAVVLVALGYRGEGDFNAALPKSRLAGEKLFTVL